jgi:hypothetical protein
MTKELFSVGRGAENDIVLPNDPKLSRNHLKLSCGRDVLIIENLSARNPIQFKNNLVQVAELQPNEKIRVGETELEFVWEGVPGERTVQASAETLALINSEKTVVRVEPPLTAPKQNNEIVAGPNEDSGRETNDNPVDFKPLVFPAKPGVPEVRYTPTSGGISTTAKSDSKRGSGQRTKKYVTTASESSKGPLIAVVAAVIVLGIVFFAPEENKSNKKKVILKDTSQIQSELNKSSETVDAHAKEKHLMEDGRIERLYESAQSYYVKGFRDYRNGQYSRAIMSFQAALSFDPSHVLARKYLNQSIKRHSEIVQFNRDQARRYRQNNNYRLCRASAQQVMIQRKDQNDPQYKDAKGLFDDCDTLSRGRF